MSNQWQPPSGAAPTSPGQPSRRSDPSSAATAPAPPPSQRSTYDDFTALLAATAARGGPGAAGGLDPRLLGNVRNQTVASLGGTLVHHPHGGREAPNAMNAPNAMISMNMNAGGWTTGGPTSQPGAEALRALALMGRLGVSPSGSALAAAVLPGAARTALGLDTESLLRRRQELIQQQQRHDAREREQRARMHVQRERAAAQAERQPREERRSAPSKVPQAGDPAARTRKQELYRSYREDNLDFYNDLVESHGREVADAIVREAVEEALGEETGGKGNDDPPAPRNEGAPQGGADRQPQGNHARRGVICIEDSDDDETRKKAPKEAKVVHAHEKGGRTLPLHPPQPHPQFSHLYKSDAVASKKRSADAAHPPAQEGRDAAKRPKPQAQSAGHHHHHHHHHRDKHQHHEKQPKQSQPTSGPAQALRHDLDRLRGQQPSQAPGPAPAVGHDLLGKLQGKPSQQPMTGGPAPTVGHDLLRTLFPALSTSPPELNTSPAPLFAAAGMNFGDASGAASARSRAHKVPPGFDEFRSDPEFCRLIVQSAYRARDQAAAGGSSDAGGLLFVRGLLNIDDESLKISSSNDSDPSLRAYVKDFINPFLNDPTSIVPQGGKLTSISRITSDNINYIARNVLYQRRKAMKSAVELAFHEIKSGQRASLPPMGSGGRTKGNADEALEWAKAMNSKPSTVAHAPDERKLKEKDDRIEELRKQLAHEKAARAKEVQTLRDAHAKEQKEVEAEYKGIVSGLVKVHKKEKEALRKKLRNADGVHKTFLDSYVEASLDALRSPSESPGLE